jgi:hypothetical protein
MDSLIITGSNNEPKFKPVEVSLNILIDREDTYKSLSKILDEISIESKLNKVRIISSIDIVAKRYQNDYLIEELLTKVISELKKQL